MTTAHRPTFDPAVGKEALRGPAYHQRLLPAHTQLKYRQAGQGGTRDLRAELLAAEAAHIAKRHGDAPAAADAGADEATGSTTTAKRPLELEGVRADGETETETETEEERAAKRRRMILLESRDVDADLPDSGADDDDDDDDEDNDASSAGSGPDSDSEEDEEAELQRELDKIRRERAERREREERERAAAEQEERERDIALGNPLLNKPTSFSMRRRWDDDVVFKNQARGTEEKGKKKEFINDLLRSDFHKRFMSKYVR